MWTPEREAVAIQAICTQLSRATTYSRGLGYWSSDMCFNKLSFQIESRESYRMSVRSPASNHTCRTNTVYIFFMQTAAMLKCLSLDLHRLFMRSNRTISVQWNRWINVANAAWFHFTTIWKVDRYHLTPWYSIQGVLMIRQTVCISL